jgi:hypothetical protein
MFTMGDFEIITLKRLFEARFPVGGDQESS